MKELDFASFDDEVKKFYSAEHSLVAKIQSILLDLCKETELASSDSLFTYHWLLFNEKMNVDKVYFVNEEDLRIVEIYWVCLDNDKELLFCSTDGALYFDEIPMYNLIQIIKNIKKLYSKD